MSVPFALSSAVAYGFGDFAGGLATRKTPVLRVTTVAQAAGLAVLLPAALLVPGQVSDAALGFGALLAPALLRCGSGRAGRSRWGVLLMAAGVLGAAASPTVMWAVVPLLLAGAAAVHAESAVAARHDKAMVQRFAAAHPDVPQRSVPALATDVHDLAGLRAVGTALAGQA